MEPIYVVGAGGIGCAVGYALRAGGVAVTFVDSEEAKIHWGRAHGLCVDRLPPLPAEFQTFAEWSPASGATVVLCTKCYDNEAVLSRLPDEVTLIPIQNGFDQALDSRGGWEGIASFVSECHPGRTHTRITRGGRLHLGERGSAERGSAGALDRHSVHPPSRARALARSRAPTLLQTLSRSRALARMRINTVEVPDILPYKYTKLMYNAAISPLAAASGLDNGQLLSVPKARQLFFDQLRENYDILRSAGVALGKVGPFHPDTVQRILRRPFLSRALSWAFYPTLRGSYCSMSGDLPRGRTEIDYYNRHLIDLAGDYPCPRNRRVYELIKRMERERIPPGVKMLEELL